MVNDAGILFGKVMHKRTSPRVNRFVYGIYYLALPLSKLSSLPISYNRFGLLSFYDADHGPRDGSDLQTWARLMLREYQLDEYADNIVLMCMPRVLGYEFNPVSFWCCFDKQQQLRAVLCEVHNTFGEQHTYLCRTNGNEPIQADDELIAEKMFHVSPFFQRHGHYQFQFDFTGKRFSITIDYFHQGKRQLLTSLTGLLQPMNKQTLRLAFWRYPLITMKAIVLIHWQALKLIVKRIAYIKKPTQLATDISQTSNLTDN